MAYSIGFIIGKIFIIMYLVIGFVWFWKRIVKLLIKLIDCIVKKNREVHNEQEQFWNDILDDKHDEE